METAKSESGMEEAKEEEVREGLNRSPKETPLGVKALRRKQLDRN